MSSYIFTECLCRMPITLRIFDFFFPLMFVRILFLKLQKFLEQLNDLFNCDVSRDRVLRSIQCLMLYLIIIYISTNYNCLSFVCGTLFLSDVVAILPLTC